MIFLADEVVIFATLDAIAVVWMFLKILANHWIDTPSPPEKIRPVKKAA